jgi:hypothetical protein
LSGELDSGKGEMRVAVVKYEKEWTLAELGFRVVREIYHP